ncbi:ferrous iron transport protein B [Pseudodesulfovibrio senegalensis]|uniref:Ferrous iron transport protein B n=1 Tax=Pseudodesulfovibrio senegalensis TaxID=1721087 RepID=A0A6N6MZB8_9BACT|nr:ferrous iron transport protein B [Pseudodesulfovibrio senegalensis]KAB1439085.1 ferrous iron transport protein B [Pseudodesulfovibrio senegalensis]
MPDAAKKTDVNVLRHHAETVAAPAPRAASAAERPLVVAVAGQPNTGKSTVFNRLTGLNQRVGNWPGKTVDRAEGRLDRAGRSCVLVDLPGTYGLTANSVEEEIARDFLLSDVPDAVLAVVNAASLERSLYLVAEIMALGLSVVVALNMMDVAEQEGRTIDADALSRAMGVPVIPLVGTSREQSLDGLVEALFFVDRSRSEHRNGPQAPEAVRELAAGLEAEGMVPEKALWTATKLAENDSSLRARLKKALDADAWQRLDERVNRLPDNAAMDVYEKRQQWIDSVCGNVVTVRQGHASPTDRWDRVLMHPLWGRIVAFVVIPLGCLLGVVLGMCTGGMALMGALSAGPQIKALLPGVLGSLMAGAVVPAAGWVLALLSIIGFIYAVFHFLEDTGYLARVACLMDPLLGRLGVDGKSAIPLLMGFLCNTVAIAGSRVVNTRRQRFITLCMLPFLPCSGQTGVAFLFAFALFEPRTALLVILGVTAVNICLACVTAVVLNRRMDRVQSGGLVMELPLYHKPNFRTILTGVRTRLEIFAKSTAGFIFAALILVWAVSYYPGGSIEHSYLYVLGRKLEPLGSFFGFDWRFVVALMSSFVAKETTAGTLAVLFSVGAGDHEAIIHAVRSAITPQGALAFVVISNLYLPCVASIVALRSELGAWRHTLALLAAMLGIALVTALASYHAGSIFL